MLVLSRTVEEEILITDNLTGEIITFKLLRNNGNKSRIGISASERFKIDRKEIIQAKSLAESSTGG